MGTSHVTTEQVKWACSDLLERNEPVFLQYRQLLTPIQWNFLIALPKNTTSNKSQHNILSINMESAPPPMPDDWQK